MKDFWITVDPKNAGTWPAPLGYVEYQLEGDDRTHVDKVKSLAWNLVEEGRIARWRNVHPAHEPVAGPTVAPVGDLASKAVGSAARFSAGKPALDLIPATVVARYTPWLSMHPPRLHRKVDWADALALLGHFQMRTREDLSALYQALREMDHDGQLWLECAQVFDYGRKKYAAWNWAKGQAWSVPIGSAMRHIVLGTLRGETLDPESGLTHRGHIACNIVMLLWFLDHFPEGDDRYVPPVRAAADAPDAVTP